MKRLKEDKEFNKLPKKYREDYMQSVNYCARKLAETVDKDILDKLMKE